MPASIFFAIAAIVAAPLVDPRDGQVYPVVQVDGVYWMARNLNFETSDSRCYDDDEQNCGRYGRLYRFDDAMASCPAGWRVPSDTDWKQLEAYIGIRPEELTGVGQRGHGLSRHLKRGGAIGFNAQFGGFTEPRENDAYKSGGSSGALWTSTISGATNLAPLVWHRDISLSGDGVWRTRVSALYRLAVRCISDLGPAKTSNP